MKILKIFAVLSAISTSLVASSLERTAQAEDCLSAIKDGIETKNYNSVYENFKLLQEQLSPKYLDYCKYSLKCAVQNENTDILKFLLTEIQTHNSDISDELSFNLLYSAASRALDTGSISNPYKLYLIVT